MVIRADNGRCTDGSGKELVETVIRTTVVSIPDRLPIKPTLIVHGQQSC
jgi:hypothetical protein